MSWRLACATAAFLAGTTSALFGQLDRQAPKYTPTIDGTITADEMAGQLEVPMSWPLDLGALVVGPEPTPEQLSAKWYISWDDTKINFSAVVLDDTPNFRLPSGGAYNGQDVIQPCFNPLNNPDHSFNPDPPAGAPPEDQGGPAAIYDMIVDTSDEFGPDIYRHGAQFTEEGRQAVKIDGKKNAAGYVLEASIPWKTAMDDVNPNYVPKVGDVHGLGLILLGFDEANAPTLFTDYGDGVNTIQDPTSWNKLTLVAARAAGVKGDFDGNGVLDTADIDALCAGIHSGGNDLKFDMNGDGFVSLIDHAVWVKTIKKTWIGDSNLDGEFNSADFVNVFTRGEYEDTTAGNSTWGDGDWNCDSEFNSSDFVVAFTDGGYEKGPVPAVSVPEPAAGLILLLGLMAFARFRQ